MSRGVGREAPYQSLAEDFAAETWQSRTIDAATVKLSITDGLEYLISNFFLWGRGVLTADGTTAYTAVKKSVDGITWSHVGAIAAAGIQIQGVATDGTTVVFLSGANIRHAVSPFTSLTSVAHSIDATYTPTDIAFGAGLFCVVSSKAGTGIGIFTRAGATSGAWTRQTNPGSMAVNSNPTDIRYSAATGFVMVCQESVTVNSCLKSADGITWTRTLLTTGTNQQFLIALNGTTVVAAGSGTGANTRMEVSFDSGTTWADVPFFTDLFNEEGLQMVRSSLSATKEGFIISARSGTGTGPNWYEEIIYRSDNGKDWVRAFDEPEILGASENEQAGPYAHNGSLLVHAVGNNLLTSAAAHAILTTT